MSSGPSREADSPPPQEPEPPGEFVSEELRSDCARFLKELRALVGLRSALPPESAAWVPARARDRARPDVTAEGRRGTAAQPPPNSRSAQSGQ